MVSCSDGSPTNTGWKRRSSALSFSMCLRYSSSVVAPMQRSSPRASAGLSMLAASCAPSAAPAPTSVCSSSMNRMTLPAALSISLSSAFRRSSNSPRYLVPATMRAEVEREHALVLEPLGHVAGGDALRDALDDGGLADAGLADEHRVVLGAPRQHLDDAADLLVAADHRVELALARHLGEVARVLLERLVLALGVLVGDALRAAHLGQRLHERVVGQPGVLERARRRRRSRSCASASSRCSVEVYSSLNLSASRSAASIRSRVLREKPTSRPPCCLGRRSSASRDLAGDALRIGADLLEQRGDQAALLLERATGRRARAASPAARYGPRAPAQRRAPHGS